MTNQSNSKRRILVVEDGTSEREALARMLRFERFDVVTAPSAEEALAQQDQAFDLVISDLRMLQQSGVDLLRAWRQRHPSMPFILLTAYGAIDAAVEAMKLGASDFLTKPVEPARLLSTVRQFLDASPASTPSEARNQRLRTDRRRIAPDPRSLPANLMRCQEQQYRAVDGRIRNRQRAVRRSDPSAHRPIATSVCRGEYGRHPRHACRKRIVRTRQRVVYRCGVLRTGCFEAAHGGTLFIDEIGDFPQHVQAKLRRRLESPTITPVGSQVDRRVDVRVVAATSRPLLAMKNAGTFREDLYYRLNVLTLRLPPLRDRREDIPLLVQHFLKPRAADGPTGRRWSHPN